jgi:hypothetical protein
MDNLIDLPGETLLELVTKSKRSQRQFAKTYGLDYEHLHSKCNNAQQREKRGSIKLPASSYPLYDNPLVMEGDAVIYNDFETPFYHAEFVNRVMELGDRWGVRQAIFGGDVLHFDSLSQWEASWIATQPGNTLTTDKEIELRAIVSSLPEGQRAGVESWLQSITKTDADEGGEMALARRSLETIGQLYDLCYFVIGNHDDRLIRALNSPILPSQLLDFIKLDGGKWKIAPFYFSRLISAGQTYQIEHPKSAAANTAVRLADKFECHTIVAHAHLQSWQWSTSGKYHAIMSGCCVDEQRLAYASQRHTNRPAHKLGAVIVRAGFPWLLTEHSDWDALKRM